MTGKVFTKKNVQTKLRNRCCFDRCFKFPELKEVSIATMRAFSPTKIGLFVVRRGQHSKIAAKMGFKYFSSVPSCINLRNISE